MWCGRADIPGMPSSSAQDDWGAVTFFPMIAFPPSPWRAEVQGNGTCRLLYIDPQGGMSNDIWTFVREKDGGAVHVETGQFNFSENPTLEIVGIEL